MPQLREDTTARGVHFLHYVAPSRERIVSE